MNGKTDNSKPLLVAIVMLGLLLCSTEAFSAINNADVMDTVLNRFKTNASSWASIIENVATRLFWTLALISMVWTFGMMALRKADIGEFFAEVVRFTVFTGFFWWLLANGPKFAVSIIDSLMQVGGSAAAMGGYSGSFSPSSIVDIGFILFGKTLGESSMWSPVDSMVGIVLGLGILILTAMIAVNILLLLISAWILAYGGIFFLGFGGARWTHDMAINFYKAVLGIAIQIMTMILLIGIGVSLINDYYTNMQTKIEFSEMAVVLIVTLTIFMLSNKVPQLLSGIITGAPSGMGMGIGQFGAGAVVGAAGVAASAATMAGSMASFGAASGVTQIAGGASALMAAFSQANANVAAGSDVLAKECLEMEKHHSQRPQASTIRLLVIQNLPRWHSLTRVPMVWVEEEKETVQEARKGGQVEAEEVAAECLEMEKHHSQRPQASTIRLLVIQNLPRWHSLTRVPMVWVEEEKETVQEARKGGQVEAEEVATECLEMEKHHPQRPQASTIRLLVIQNLPRWHSLTRVPMVWVEEEEETAQEARKGRVKAKRPAKEHKVILLGLMPAVAVCSRLLVWRPQRPQE